MELSVHGKTIRKIFLLADKIHYQDGLRESKEEHGTDFDISLVKGWREKSVGLAYDVETSVKSRQVGPYVVQLQVDRAKTRRPPDAMDKVTAPFDPDKFNFTKIDFDKEAIFELRTDPDEVDSDFVVVNVSPVEFGHSLLVPNLWDKLPQVVTDRSILVAAKAVMASGLSNFKAAYNSLCGHASVNHLHWHLYYLRKGFRLPLETVEGTHLGYGCYSLLDYSAPGFGFQISHVDQMEDVSRRVGAVAKLFCDLNIAHNIFITKGTPFQAGGSRNKVIKVMIWARKNVTGAKDLLELGWTVATCELGGHILVYDDDKYEAMTEAEIAEGHREACQEPFEAVKDRVVSTLKAHGDVQEDMDSRAEEVDLASSDGEHGKAKQALA